ncbi:MAG TPA: hypothetical protein VKA15_03600, partial [Isosphaeraceae bacterium]|nr:hypothetical protein [Isosphaeraceae bacterium]
MTRHGLARRPPPAKEKPVPFGILMLATGALMLLFGSTETGDAWVDALPWRKSWCRTPDSIHWPLADGAVACHEAAEMRDLPNGSLDGATSPMGKSDRDQDSAEMPRHPAALDPEVL